MPKLVVYTNVSLDGYYADANNEMGWAHENADPEFQKAGEESARGGSILLMGRVTYEMMERFWPTAEAQKQSPAFAKVMNESPKVVASRSLDKATWQNTTIIKDDLVGEVKKLKAGPGEQITVLGSGSIVQQLARAGLVDEYQLIYHPVVLGAGKSEFAGVGKLRVERTSFRTFPEGNVQVSYVPAKE